MTDCIDQLAHCRTAAARYQYLRANPAVLCAEFVEQLHEAILTRVLSDVNEAANLARAAGVIARNLGHDRSIALGYRAKGNVQYIQSRFAPAVASYRRAAAIFKRIGHDHELARTFSSALQSLIYLGHYETALHWADEARATFESEQDELRLARLDSNVGNLYYRQDRYGEALTLYRSALERFRHCGQNRTSPQCSAIWQSA